MSKSKLSQQDIDDQFEAFLRESVSSESSLGSARVQKYLNQKKRADERPWWMREDDSSSSLGGTGLTGTGRSFMKAKTSDDKKEFKPSFVNPRPVDTAGGAGVGLSLSKDSLDDVPLFPRDSEKGIGSAVIPALSLETSQSFTDTGPAPQVKPGTDSQNLQYGADTLQYGADTLDELAEKEKFFQALEKSGEAVDYGKLNKDLDQSATIGTTNSPPLLRRGTANHAEESKERSADSTDAKEDSKTSSADDSRDLMETSKKQNKPPKGASDMKTANLLSQVSLSDSLNSTLDTKPAGSRDMLPIPEERDEDESESKSTGISQKEAQDEVDNRDHLQATEQENGTESASKWQRETAESTSKWETGKTLHGTETSLEIEALHAALKEVGMSTLGTMTKEFSLPETLSHDAVKSHDQNQASQDTAGSGGTPGFGFHKILPPSHTDDKRTVEDIIREVEELQDDIKNGKVNSALSRQAQNLDKSDFEEDEQRGFDLSPVHSRPFDFNLSPDRNENKQGLTDAVVIPSDKMTELPPSPSKADKLGKKKSKSKFGGVKSSGYGQKGSPKSSHVPKSSLSPAEVSKQRQRGRGTESYGRVGTGQSSLNGSQAMASAQSLASYMQQNCPAESPVRPTPEDNLPHSHLSVAASQERLSALEREKALIAEVKEWQEQWKTERKMYAKLKADVAMQEKENSRAMEQMKMLHEQEIFKLKQDNFVLSAKVAESDTQSELKKKVMDGEPLDGAGNDQLSMMEKEIREQEKLLLGYQQENERLYMELKRLQTSSKASEERMFRENQRLSKEASNLREELDRKASAYENRGVITSQSVQQQIAAGGASVGAAVLGAGRIAQIEAELRQTKEKAENLQKEVETLEKTRTELETHIDTLIRNRERYEEKVNVSRNNKTQEMVQMEQKYQSEIDRLNRKLKWYAENQELLDGDARVIQEKNLEISELKSKLEDLRTDAGKKKEEVQLKSRERASDAKKILDLERQVKEMENIIRKRHPNSLPVLMWAASTAPDQPAAKTPSVQFLENRISKLEKELEEKDEEGKRSLRAMEQKHLALKFKYEERIESLESQLPANQQAQRSEVEHPHTHSLALQRELDATRERHKKKVAEMEAEMDKLKKELMTLKSKEAGAAKGEQKAQKERETELELRVKMLQSDLSNKDRELQLQQKAVERLQHEKQLMFLDTAAKSAKVKKGKAGVKGKKISPRDETQENSHPLTLYEEGFNPNKTYEPTTFSGVHIEDVLKENEALKMKVDQLMIECDQQRVELSKSLAVTEAIARRSQEEADEQLTALKAAHKAEIERLLTEHAMQHSTSRLAELQSKVDTQEVIVKHLKQQLAQNSVDSEKMAAVKIREAALETQVKQLLDDLREARSNHTPQMKHFEALTEKINKMEERHRKREQELQTVITQTKMVASHELHEEARKWQNVIETKNNEIQRFRAELDAILEVLRELHRQGVVLPARSVVRYT